jgi:hypothetical protein
MWNFLAAVLLAIVMNWSVDAAARPTSTTDNSRLAVLQVGTDYLQTYRPIGGGSSLCHLPVQISDVEMLEPRRCG